MLGYNQEDILIMQECIETSREFYRRMTKEPYRTRVTTGLEQAYSFFDGLLAEGYFDNA